MNTYQVLIILVVDTRVLSCVADSLQKCRFASISPTDYQDTKVSICRSEVIEIKVTHDRERNSIVFEGVPYFESPPLHTVRPSTLGSCRCHITC